MPFQKFQLERYNYALSASLRLPRLLGGIRVTCDTAFCECEAWDFWLAEDTEPETASIQACERHARTMLFSLITHGPSSCSSSKIEILAIAETHLISDLTGRGSEDALPGNTLTTGSANSYTIWFHVERRIR